MTMGDLQSWQRRIVRVPQRKGRSPDKRLGDHHRADEPRHPSLMLRAGAYRAARRFKPTRPWVHDLGGVVGFDAQGAADQMPPTKARMGVAMGDGPDGKGHFVNPQGAIGKGEVHGCAPQNPRPRWRGVTQRKDDVPRKTNPDLPSRTGRVAVFRARPAGPADGGGWGGVQDAEIHSALTWLSVSRA